MEYAVVEVKQNFKQVLLPEDRIKSHLVVKCADIYFLSKREKFADGKEFRPWDYDDFDSKNLKLDYFLTRRVCPELCKEQHSHLKDVRVYIKLLGKKLPK